MFDFTVGLASFPRTSAAEQRLFAAIAERADTSSDFFSALSGVTQVGRFLSPAQLVRLVGLRGFRDLARARQRHPEPRPAPAAESSSAADAVF